MLHWVCSVYISIHLHNLFNWILLVIIISNHSLYYSINIKCIYCQQFKYSIKWGIRIMLNLPIKLCVLHNRIILYYMCNSLLLWFNRNNFRYTLQNLRNLLMYILPRRNMYLMCISIYTIRKQLCFSSMQFPMCHLWCRCQYLCHLSKFLHYYRFHLYILPKLL